MNVDTLTDLAFLALVVNAVVNGLAAPIRSRYPRLNLWWLSYVSFALGLLVVLLPLPVTVFQGLAVAGAASGLFDIIKAVGKN